MNKQELVSQVDNNIQVDTKVSDTVEQPVELISSGSTRVRKKTLTLSDKPSVLESLSVQVYMSEKEYESIADVVKRLAVLVKLIHGDLIALSEIVESVLTAVDLEMRRLGAMVKVSIREEMEISEKLNHHKHRHARLSAEKSRVQE